MRSLSFAILISICTILSAAHASTNLNDDSFQAYYIDLNADGVDDLYLKAVPRWVLLAFEIIVPITTYDSKNIWLEGGGGARGSYSSPQEWGASVDVSGLEKLDYQLRKANFNNDEYSDLFLLSESSELPAVVLFGTSGAAPSIGYDLANYSQYFDASSIYDFNGDGKEDIVFGADARNDILFFATRENNNYSNMTLALSVDATGESMVLNQAGYEPLEMSVGKGGIPHIPSYLAATNNQVVSELAGELSVTPSGAALYRVPLQIPASISGLVPELGLSYSSQVGNGHVGVGWQLTGLKAITRCRPTLAQNGTNQADFGSTGMRFCLQGQQLINVPAKAGSFGDYFLGNYHEQGTEYRTESESFNKIVSYGNKNGTPASFKVWTKASNIETYAITQDNVRRVLVCAPNGGKCIERTAGTVAKWALSSIEDRFGNIITYNYGTENNDFYLESISYDGGSVELVYDDRDEYNINNRDDNSWSFYLGFETSTNKLLRQIAVRGSGINKKYQLSYQASPVTGRLRLTSLVDCGYSRALGVEEISSCSRPTRFEWQDGEVGFDTPESLGFTTDQVTGEQPLLADINGDGYQDLLWSDDRGQPLAGGPSVDVPTWYVAHGSSNGFTAPQDTGVWLGAQKEVAGLAQKIGLNYNGTYTEGLVVATYDLSMGYLTWYTMVFDSSLAHEVASWTIAYSWGLKPIVTDLDGDGMGNVIGYMETEFVDLVNDCYRDDSCSGHQEPGIVANTAYIASPIEIGSNQGEASGTMRIFWSENNLYSGFLGDNRETDLYGALTLDYNRDGYTDIFTKDYINRTWNWLRPEHVGPHEYDFDLVSRPLELPIGDGEDGNGLALDINKDGLADFVVRVNFVWHVYINKGGYFSAPVVTSGVSNGNPQRVIPTDFDGDGTVDLLVEHDNKWRVLLTVSEYENNEASVNFLIVDNGIGNGSINSFGFYNSLPNGLENRRPEAEKPLVADINGDGLADMLYRTGSQWNVIKHRNKTPDLITQFNKGFGHKTNVTYAPISQPDVHQHIANAGFPNVAIRSGMTLVKQVKSANLRQRFNEYNPSTYNSINYQYKGAKINLQGRGFLGFSELVKIREQGAIDFEYKTQFSQVFPFIGREVAATTKLLPSNRVISISENDWQSSVFHSNRITYPYLSATRQASFDVATGSSIVAKVNDYTYDEFGSVLSRVSATGKSLNFNTNQLRNLSKTVSIENVFIHNENDWLIGFLNSSSVTHQVPGETTKNQEFYYKPHSGSLRAHTTVNLWDSNVSETTFRIWDAYGRLLSIEKEGADADGRLVLSNTYLSSNKTQLVDVKENALGQSVEYSYDNFGLSRVIDLNGLVTDLTRNTYGQNIGVTYADGSIDKTSRQYCTYSSGCPSRAIYLIKQRTAHNNTLFAGSPENTSYFDALNRKIRTSSRDFAGELINVDYTYDLYGRVNSTTVPYSGSSTQLFNSLTYDNYGRLERELKADGSQVNYTYRYQSSGYLSMANTIASTVIKPDGSSIIKTYTNYLNSLNQVVQRNDRSQMIHYDYDAIGNLRWAQIGSNANTTVETNYDIAGNVTSVIDPNTGTSHFVYDGLGLLKSTTDANQKTITYGYDLIDRKITENSEDGNYEWSYDNTDISGAKSLGQLSKITGTNYQKTFHYDELSRVQRVDYLVNGTAYNSLFEFDDYSRISAQTYPSGLKIAYQSNAVGYAVESNNAVTGQVYKKTLAQDAWGNVSSSQLGNGLISQTMDNSAFNGLLKNITASVASNKIQDIDFEFDTQGTLWARDIRTNNNLQYQDRFTYDSLDRLTRTSLSGHIETMAYTGVLGNIAHKSDVGSYRYYNDKPHAVRSTLLNGVTTSYGYDSVGNVTTLGDTNITYNLMNKPVSIVKGSKSKLFSYAPTGNRFYQLSSENNIPVSSTTYLPSTEIIKDEQTGEVITKTYFDDQVMHVTTKNGVTNDTQTKVQYLLKDHQGSTTHILDSLGNLLSSMGYKSFGARDNAPWASAIPDSETQNKDLTSRGYTGHEHLDDFGLIHMNGRIYSPLLGRMLSADPFIQDLGNSQNYNRYSYVLNNPLSLTDPSGYNYMAINDIGMSNNYVPNPYYDQNLANLANYNTNNTWNGSGSYYTPNLDTSATITTSNINIASASANNGIAWFTPVDKPSDILEPGMSGVVNAPVVASANDEDDDGIPDYFDNDSTYNSISRINAVGIGTVFGPGGGGQISFENSAKAIKNARQRGVNRAKSGERDLVKSGHPGTADNGGWSFAERKRIAETGQFPSDTRWHHINDVKRNPGSADVADNVIPSRGGNAGHVSKYHPNGTQAGSSGSMLNRSQLKNNHMNGN